MLDQVGDLLTQSEPVQAYPFLEHWPLQDYSGLETCFLKVRHLKQA